MTFLRERERELLLILVTIVGIEARWVPGPHDFRNIYVASEWVLSYDYGLIRRGLIGTIVKLCVSVVSIRDVQAIALTAYCVYLAFLLIIFSVLLKNRDKAGNLFRLVLLFLVTPATIAMLAHNLGRFDLFLVMILSFSVALLSFERLLWLIPLLAVTGVFIHEGFVLLYAPTILSLLFFEYRWNRNNRRILLGLTGSASAVAVAFFLLYWYGSPKLGYDQFSHLIQVRAAFPLTTLSMRECYYGMNDHIALAASSLFDAGSMANLALALIILSPVALVLIYLWSRIIRSCPARRGACWLVVLASLSGLMAVPLATDYGRWLSAVAFCNFVSVFFFVGRGILKLDELPEYEGGAFSLSFVTIVVVYLLFGPLHDWNPYPYRTDIAVSSLFLIAVLLVDVGFLRHWTSVREVVTMKHREEFS